MATERVTEKSTQESPLEPGLAEEIQRALELMERVRMANAEQAEKALKTFEGNIYVLPEPLIFCTGSSA